jgi:hypothetical protein
LGVLDSRDSREPSEKHLFGSDTISTQETYLASIAKIPAVEKTDPLVPRPSAAVLEAALSHEIEKEIEWRGTFLKRVREARRISIEELSSNTKITRSYLFAIEEEHFSKLPAAVYLRGFLVQIAKILRLPHEKVAAAYMARYYQARPDQVH